MRGAFRSEAQGVAGVYAPALVERYLWRELGVLRWTGPMCRRGLRPGLG